MQIMVRTTGPRAEAVKCNVASFEAGLDHHLNAGRERRNGEPIGRNRCLEFRMLGVTVGSVCAILTTLADPAEVRNRKVHALCGTLRVDLRSPLHYATGLHKRPSAF